MSRPPTAAVLSSSRSTPVPPGMEPQVASVSLTPPTLVGPGGKAEVVRLLKKRAGHGCVAVVGDGVTDMEARPPADVFIGFGGNVVRDPVRAGADWFVSSFDDLIHALA